LSEIEIGAGAVADVHRLAKTLLGVVTVKYDRIKDDGYALENNFDNATDERPGLLLVSRIHEDLSENILPAFYTPVRSLLPVGRADVSCYRHKTSPKYPCCCCCS
jgi:hypothetical protein